MADDAKKTKRNCAQDTKAMEELGRKIFDLSWVETYFDELDDMNDSKVGRRFVFSASLISWALILRTVLRISYRLTLGIVNASLSEYGLPNISLTQLFNRCIESHIVMNTDDERFLAYGRGNVPPSDHPITVALDSTGISINKYGGWLVNKWGMKKVSGWIKLHVAVDTATNEILSFVITDEHCGDITCTDLLMEQVLAGGHKVVGLLADAAYDSKANWKKYTEMGMKVCINIKSKNLTDYAKPTGHLGIRSHGCMVRGTQIKRIDEIGREEWKKENGYNRRWRVECTFSDLKRILGDILRSRTRLNGVLEALDKVSVHNLYKEIRKKYAEA